MLWKKWSPAGLRYLGSAVALLHFSSHWLPGDREFWALVLCTLQSLWPQPVSSGNDFATEHAEMLHIFWWQLCGIFNSCWMVCIIAHPPHFTTGISCLVYNDTWPWAVNFYMPVWKTDILCHGNVYPSVCLSVHLSVHLSVFPDFF